MYKSTGKIIYNPYRGDKNNHNWCILSVSPGIIGLYQSLIKLDKFIVLNQPSWGAHCTIVRGEKFSSPNWKKYDNTMMEFEYDPCKLYVQKDAKQDGHFFCIPVYSDKLNEIRKSLGLREHNNFHITIGRTYY